jgi:hypothetical protein
MPSRRKTTVRTISNLNPQRAANLSMTRKREVNMKLKETVPITGAAGYILLWLLGIPIPILLIIFLLRGCT